MVDTVGLGAGSYPEAPEKETKIIKGKIYIEYKFEMEVPKEWDKADIVNDMWDNTKEYMQDLSNIDYDF